MPVRASAPNPAPSARPGPLVTTAPGMRIATWDLGGEGPELLLIHGTGFHGRCWAPMAEALGRSFHVWALDQRGHGRSEHSADRAYDDWSRFVDDLLAVVDHLGLERPFAGGHSLGGAVAILAEQQRPGTFAGIYAYEPIIIPPRLISLAEGNRRLRDLALKRRNVFDSVAAARANFAGKAPFDRFEPAVLDAYLEGGLSAQPDGTVALSCPGDEEASVYEGATRHHAYEHLGEMDLPVAVAGSAEDGDIDPALLGDLAGRIRGARLHPLRGVTHFGPMEQPVRLADEITRALL